MEHLELPSKPQNLAIEVPCLCVKGYDGGEFLSYLERASCSEEQILFPQRFSLPPEIAISHLQRWLFFGSLEQLSSPSPGSANTTVILREVCTRKNQQNEDFVSTLHLRDLWKETKLELASANDADQDRFRNHMATVLQRSNLLISRLEQSSLPSSLQAVVLSIILLNEFIMEAMDFREIEDRRPYLRSVLIESVMRERGWCPSDIERLRLDLDVSALVFAAACGPPPSLRSHQECSRTLCYARQILDDEAYQPKHVHRGDCHCEDLSTDMITVLESLDAKVIPVTVLHSRTAEVELKTLRQDTVPRYVAVSHVWSDKMGNRAANALPQCLLIHIQQCVNALYDENEMPVPFWIDTLSCPVAPHAARNQAISLMRETYRNADKVLVFDSYLESTTDAVDRTDFEQALRIICSGWTRRLWTLQEGVLAKDIYFQFAGVAINADDLFVRLATPPISYRTIPLFHSWLEIRLSWNGKLDSLEMNSEFVWMLYRALRFRTTSWLTDEPLCLATLAGVDVGEILKERRENRMRRFWELIPKLSTALMYWNGPRLTMPGLRWAPASLLNSSPEAFHATSATQILKAKQAYRTSAGLVFTSPGILLGKWTTSIHGGFWLPVDDTVWNYIELASDIGPPRSLTRNDTTVVGQLAGWDGTSTPPQVLALLATASSHRDLAAYHNQAQSNPESVAVVSIYGTGLDGLFYASFEAVAVVRPVRIDQMSPSLGFPALPTMCQVVKHELRSAKGNGKGKEKAGVAAAMSSSNTWEHEDQCTPDAENLQGEIVSLRQKLRPDRDSGILLVEDPSITAVMEDGRLNLVVNDEHVVFEGAPIPPTQCFCLG